MVRFTYRERSILKRLRAGCDAAEIAYQMDLSVATVNRHLRRCQDKAALQHRGQLICYTYQQPQCTQQGAICTAGLIPLEKLAA